MASERQIEANWRNSERSCGPKSEAGKARSRVNATKHGMTAELPDVEATLSPEFQDRRARWAAEQNPVGEAGNWAMDRVIAATFRIERCEQTIDAIITDTQSLGELAWDQDRAVEAATVAARLSRDPVLASRQLQTTFAGVGLLIEAWLGLAAALQSDRDWTESEVSIALDLLGVSPELRSGRTLIDAPEGADPIPFRKGLTFNELNRLEELRDMAMAPLEDMEQRRAVADHSALLSKQAKLVLRYEREAWKRYWESMKELKANAPAAPPVVAPTPPPPPPPSRAVAPPPRTESTNRLAAMGLVDDNEWLDAPDRRTDRLNPLPGSYVPIAAGVRPPGR